MNKAQTRLVAEILVEMDYAKSSNFCPECRIEKVGQVLTEVVNITSDTLEARRQGNVVEGWLWVNHYNLWQRSCCSQNVKQSDTMCGHQWRKDRILWCLDKLTGDKI